MLAPVVTVFGGNGFIGKRIVRRLLEAGCRVRVVSRQGSASASLMSMIPETRRGALESVAASVSDQAGVEAALDGAEMAINLVSILSETRGERFSTINIEAAGRVAQASSKQKIRRFLHVSAIGAAPDAPSRYGRSKAGGEALVRAAVPNATILRPSVVFGPGDRFLTLFALLAKISPILPVTAPDTILQPVFVDDVAQAAVSCLLSEEPKEGVFELGGPERCSMKEVMAFAAQCVGRSPLLLPLPERLAFCQAFLFEHLPGKLLTRDHLAMLSRDNVVSEGCATFGGLGIVPRSIRTIAPSYLGKLTLTSLL